MHIQLFKIIVFTVIVLCFSTQGNSRPSEKDESKIRVSMRLIGHRILLDAGDSLSVVLPIEKENDRYKIQFENDFLLSPTSLSATINKVIEETGIAKNYMVEVESCRTKQVVHGFEVRDVAKLELDQLACSTRNQDKDCYQLYVTILDDQSSSALPVIEMKTEPSKQLSEKKKSGIFPIIGLAFLPFLCFIIWYFYPKKEETEVIENPNLITIGDYQFDQKNMLLLYNNETTELTSKEADLLQLLYQSENITLERENILNVVWGDEGDYVGRTLDVFISKLRKKLSADAGLKIVNVRGVGYKFIMNSKSR